MTNGNDTLVVPYNRATDMAYSAFVAISWVTVFEIVVKSLFIFKKKNGLYFWSIQVTCFGIMLNSTGLLLHFFVTNVNQMAVTSMNLVGWWCFVTGQAVVLYSRLNLVVQSKKTLRLVLLMIIANFLLMQVPTAVIAWGSNAQPHSVFTTAYTVIEKIQVIIFCLQEAIISLIYIFSVKELLRQGNQLYKHKKAKRVLRHLIYINILVILLNSAYVASEYAQMYYMQCAIKPAVYAYQLYLEFTILNQLMSILGGSTKSGKVRNDASAGGLGRKPFVDDYGSGKVVMTKSLDVSAHDVHSPTDRGHSGGRPTMNRINSSGMTVLPPFERHFSDGGSAKSDHNV